MDTMNRDQRYNASIGVVHLRMPGPVIALVDVQAAALDMSRAAFIRHAVEQALSCAPQQ